MTRMLVKCFANMMEAKLRTNDLKKVDWQVQSTEELVEHLSEELDELMEALDGKGDIGEEAVDVALISMMLLDRHLLISQERGRKPWRLR